MYILGKERNMTGKKSHKFIHFSLNTETANNVTQYFRFCSMDNTENPIFQLLLQD